MSTFPGLRRISSLFPSPGSFDRKALFTKHLDLRKSLAYPIIMNTDTNALRWFGIDLFNVALNRTTSTVVALIGLDIIWWVLMYNGAVPMPGMMWLMNQNIPLAAPGAMELGVFQVGTLSAVIGYIVMWGVMMWAMMYPAMTRFTREYAAAHEGSAIAVTKAMAMFLVGYHLLWAFSGMIPLTIHAALPGGIYGFTQAHTYLAIGGTLIFTGGYQLTMFKQSRLRACCAHVDPHTADTIGALKDGISHGISCMLTCFAPFFLIMPFFGEMNFFWMVALTGVVALERLPEWGREISVASGVVAFVAGMMVLVLQPALPITFAI